MNNADVVVLLVDDDEMIRDCVTAYLEDEGYLVYSAGSGEAGLKMIGALRPAVCISDMRLRGMNGEEFIAAAHDICPETAFLLHTGMIYSLSDELRATGMTAADVLLKPIHELSILVDKIRQKVAGRKK